MTNPNEVPSDKTYEWQKCTIQRDADKLLDDLTHGNMVWRFKATSEDSTGCSLNGRPYPSVEIEGFVSDDGTFYILSERVWMPKEVK